MGVTFQVTPIAVLVPQIMVACLLPDILTMEFMILFIKMLQILAILSAIIRFHMDNL